MQFRSKSMGQVGAFLVLSGLLAGVSRAQEEAWRDDPTLVRAHSLPLTVGELALDPHRPELRVELFDGRSVLARGERTALTRDEGFTWYGALESDPRGYLALAVQGDALVGVLREGRTLYRLRDSRGGVVLYESDPSRLAPCATAGGSPAAGPGPVRDGLPGGGTGLQGAEDGVLEVDVIVGWTPEAETLLGSEAAMKALIDLAVLEANVALDKSLVDIDLRLVYSAEVVGYVEAGGNMATDLDRLRATNDGYMDEVHTWRNTYGADIVSLMLANNFKCGRSYNMGAPPSAGFAVNAFNVVNQDCATGTYGYAHEVGHTMGLDHDRPNTSNVPSWPYAYGYRTVDDNWRTIMSLELAGSNAVRIDYFSNPNLSFMGQVLGVPEGQPEPSDCTLALNNNAAIVANWRPTRIGSLVTTFANDNFQDGAMFNVVAKTPLVLQGLDVHFSDTQNPAPCGTSCSVTEVEVYKALGGYVGKQNDPSAWTLVGSTQHTVATGPGVPQPLDLPLGLPMDPAAPVGAPLKYGLYVTATGTYNGVTGEQNENILYTEGTDNFENDDLLVKSGMGVEYPFASTFSKRVFNGAIHYTTYESLSYCTAGTSASGCQALMSTSGIASATASSGFFIHVDDVEGAKDGTMYIGLNGRQANSWGNGTSYQCVVPPVFRGGQLSAVGTPGQCDGTFSQDWNATWCPTCPLPLKNPGAGAVVQASLWYRDPLNTSNRTTSLSNGIEFTVVP